jgi:hypothetical protein
MASLSCCGCFEKLPCAAPGPVDPTGASPQPPVTPLKDEADEDVFLASVLGDLLDSAPPCCTAFEASLNEEKSRSRRLEKKQNAAMEKLKKLMEKYKKLKVKAHQLKVDVKSAERTIVVLKKFVAELQAKHRKEVEKAVSDKMTKDQTCSICLNPNHPLNSIVLPCAHQFHSSCIVESLRRTGPSCPMCRHNPYAQ